MLQHTVTTCQYLPLITSNSNTGKAGLLKSRFEKFAVELKMKIRSAGMSLAKCLWCCSCGSQFGRARYTRLLSIDVKFYQFHSLTWLAADESPDEAAPITECLASGEVRGVRPKILSSLWTSGFKEGYVTTMLARPHHRKLQTKY